MPKATNGKKRKRDKKKDEERNAKKAKSNDDGGVKQSDVELEGEGYGSEKPCEKEPEIDDIDEILEENAARNNLTAINVRSILHHVVTDKRVLAMVKSVAAEVNDEQGDDTAGVDQDVGLDFAPKMTRAKSKQTNQGDPIAALASQSPIKDLKAKQTSKNKKIHFTELELPESSSDEEYNPDDEDASDDDTESFLSFSSDLASPAHMPGTPESHKTETTESGEPAESTKSPTVTRSCSKRLLQEPFKVPYPVTLTASAPFELEEITVLQEGDLIAKRTRSQLPLQDVSIESIEATFQPPDFTADMYDSIPVDDMDFEDIEWQKWLQGLVNSDEVCGEDDQEDTEYNFMAEDQKEEKEEYRNDRAVRIPQKEVNELFEELLKDFDDNEDGYCVTDEGEPVGYLEMLSSGTSGQDNVQLFSQQQLDRLNVQLQQHTQLLTQIYLMSREDDSLSKEAKLTRDYVTELKGFQDRACNAQLIRGLGDGKVHTSAFSFPGLEDAVEIVNSTFVPKRRTPSPRKCATPKKDNKSPAKTARRSRRVEEELLPSPSDTNVQLMAANTNVFQFVELLPHHNLLPRTGDTPKQLNGLRVKFSDAEDNLLAMGMKQLGKKWDLIQEHLLPVKSPKQLQIRCKNLLSARAPENVVKYYRRYKEIWIEPTRVQVSTEHRIRRQRSRQSLEPEWMKNYKKREKERRENQEKAKAKVVKQKIEGTAYGRPIAPKFSAGACAVALPTGSGSAGNAGTVTWVAITTSTSPWKAVAPPKPVEVVREVDNSDTVTNVRSSPVSNTMTTSEDNSPPSLASAPEPDLDTNVDSNHSSVNDETVAPMDETSDNEPIVPPSEADSNSSNAATKETNSEQENASKEATEKTSSANTSNKPVPVSKSKASRDKNGGSVACGRVTSKSHVTGSESGGAGSGTSRKAALNSQAGMAGSYILEPDPKFRNRAQAFAEHFVAKVKKQLTDDPETYEEFLRTLAMSSQEQCSPVELYRRVEVVLADYPDLVEGFVGFLEPHQAVEAGVFMANLEFVRARTFLRKLEVHFQRTPSQFRKIINAFHSWNKKAVKDPLELRQTLVPMLKGQTHLIEELNSFFEDTKPPVCSDDDFEEFEFGSGSEPEVDDFEEVEIPCFVEPKKMKGRPPKETQKNKTRKNKKPSGIAKGSKQQGNASKPAGSKTKTKTNLSKGDKQYTLLGGSVGENEGGNLKHPPSIPTNGEVTGEESGLDDQRNEVHPQEGPLSSTATSLQSETSNDSYHGEELNPASGDTLSPEHEEREVRNYESEEQEDDGNSDVEHDGYEEDEDDYFLDGEPAVYNNDFTSGDLDCDVVVDVRSDAAASDCGSGDVDMASSGVVPAKNLQRSEDGQVVLLWTRFKESLFALNQVDNLLSSELSEAAREDDRTILQTCQQMGAKSETFQHIADSLKNKTAAEVQKRFMDLLNLFKASSGDRTRESTNEDSCSEDEAEDEEDSETIGESDGEQAHDA